ncbi:MAG TPA: T9SS type A sorting domain-containing protein [Saprospiraceae bacterium]|nr:T9SS type A sorting domain-containing protein [Saprospiraceae bacterium]
MKNLKNINQPIPKWTNHIRKSASKVMLLLLVFQFCNEMKAVPEDWPSSDRVDVQPMHDNELENLNLPCHGLVQISVDQSGRAYLTPQMLITDKLPSYGKFKVYVNETGLNYVSCSDIGKKRTATVLDTTNGMSCWSELKVEDKLMPVLVCRVDTVMCILDPFELRYDTMIMASDNCDASLTILYDLRFERLQCDLRYSGISHLLYTVTDDYGNKTTCAKDVYFRKPSLSDVVFPADDTLYCPNPDISSLEVPTIFGEPIDAFCDLLPSHLDDTIPVCGGMIKIQRRWFVMNWCTRMTSMETQLITIADTTRPEIICPADVTLFTEANKCFNLYRIPTVTATDACSPAFLMIYAVRIDSFFLARPGQSVELSTGKHTMQYIAIDPCGNSDTCISYATVVDNIPPTLICPPKLIFSLDGTGQSTLNAAYFSKIGFFTDNCAVDTVLVRRMTNRCNRPQDTTFRDQIYFCCADAGMREMIVVKVVDESGNSNFCMIEVEIQNKNVFAINCPANVTLSCTQNMNNLNLTGRVTISGVCVDTTTNGITFSDSGKLDSCRRGVFIRKWRVNLRNGVIDSSCRQRIEIVNNYVFDARDFIWARDTMVRGCRSNHPDSLGLRPLNPRDSCGTIVYTWRDSTLNRPADSCRRILRLWQARSLCNGAIARDTQVINVSDFGPPRLKGPRDTAFCSTNTECNPFLVLAPVVVTSCNTIISITNDFNGGGANASGVYPLGKTRVIFTARDICNNIGRDTVFVDLADKMDPDADCKRLLVNIQANDSAKIIARDLLSFYQDNCTPTHKLVITFDLNNPNDTCRYIPCSIHRLNVDSIYTFRVFVLDSSGNAGSCNALVDVDDPNNFCNSNFQTTIHVTGLVRDVKGNPMEKVEMLEQGTGQMVSTDLQGKYMNDQIKPGSSVHLKPDYALGNWTDGLSTQDVLYLQKHILGISTFSKPEQWIAADLDKDGFVTTRDIVWLRKLILGKVEEVPTNKSWRFLDEEYIFNDHDFPLREKFSEDFETDHLMHDKVVNFKSIKVGDVSGSSGFQEKVAGARLRYFELGVEDHLLPENQRSHSDFMINDDLTMEGLQINMSFDSRYAEVDRIVEFLSDGRGVDLSEDSYFVKDRELRISLSLGVPKRLEKGQRVFRIVWRNKISTRLSDLLRDTEYRNNEIFLVNSLASPISIRILGLSGNDELEINRWGIRPNPFKDRCKIEFESSLNVDAYLELMNTEGKVVYGKWRSIEKGLNTWEIESGMLGGSGVYLYRLQAGKIMKKGKIVLLK